MDDLLLLLLLLSVRTAEICSLPYAPGSDGLCQNSTTEYLNNEINLCCKKCRPGYREVTPCSQNSETVCQPCGGNQYQENWNIYKNCFACTKCKESKGLKTLQNCTSSRNSKCTCQPGMFCEIESHEVCTACRKYRVCKPGFRVSQPGSLFSDVKCEKCPTEGCETVDNTLETTTTTVTTASARIRPDSPLATYVGSRIVSPKPDVMTDSVLAPVLTSVAVFLILAVHLVLLFLYKRKRRNDFAITHEKVDANGNSEIAEKPGHDCFQHSPTPFTPSSLEHMRLLANRDVISEQSQSSSNSKTSTREEGCSSRGSVSLLQPDSAESEAASALSEPLTLQSVTEAPPGVPAQSPSQLPTPHLISPITNSPHVNVNITLHIGNGSCGGPTVQPTDLSQMDSRLPFGQEEESVSSPTQEAGKHLLMSVQENDYCYA